MSETTRAALLALARQATNGWACYARTKREHDDIARLHRELDALAAQEAPAGQSCGAPALDVEALVAAIQGELFVNGFGEPAIRLQMRGYGERDLGGWSKLAVATRVRAALDKVLAPSSLAAPEDAGTVPPKG